MQGCEIPPTLNEYSICYEITVNSLKLHIEGYGAPEVNNNIYK